MLVFVALLLMDSKADSALHKQDQKQWQVSNVHDVQGPQYPSWYIDTYMISNVVGYFN